MELFKAILQLQRVLLTLFSHLWHAQVISYNIQVKHEIKKNKNQAI